jgi:uncharacterized membrane protein YhaH (DUF805 family)
MNWYIGAFKKGLDFSGRARRQEYWMFVLVGGIVSVVLTIIDVTVLSGVAGGIGLLTGVYSLVALVPALAAGVRRLHDTGRSGWWFFIVLIPLFGAITLLVFYVLDSEPGTNQYGPNPKAVGAAGMAWGD